jgi:putative DNA primase/helicase
MRYHTERKRWLIWSGQRWEEDDTDAVARFAKETVMEMYGEAAETEDGKRREELSKWAVRSESAARLRDMVTLAKSECGVPVRENELDRDPWLINLLNGSLNLRTGTLAPHDRDKLVTKLSRVCHDSSAACPLWLAFLNRVLDGNTETIAYVQRAIGYSLTGVTSEQVLFFLFGLGANGKSVFMETLRRLVGEYAAQADFSTFLERRGDGPRNDLAKLRGSRIVLASEAGERHRLDEALVKQLTGGDTITARYLFGEYFEFRPQFKLWLAANHKPTIRSMGEAIWRRIRLIPFTVTIPEAERDPILSERLAEELPGILRWAVEGCLEWQRVGLGEAKAITSATVGYRQEMDSLGGFLGDACILTPNARSAATPLYRAYRQWCEANGEEALSQRDFGLRLPERDLHKTRGGKKGGFVWHGVGLRTEQLISAEPQFDNLPSITSHEGSNGKPVQSHSVPSALELGDAFEPEAA